MSAEIDELKEPSHRTTVSLDVLVLRSQDRRIKPVKARSCFQPIEKILSSIDQRSSLAFAA